jgi:hypothetical protein
MRTALALLCIPGLALAQQRGASITVGAASVWYDGAPSANSVTLSPTLTLLAPTTYIGLSGTVAQFSAARLATQGTLEVATFTAPTPSGAMGEVGFTLGGSSLSDGLSTGQGMLNARLRVLRTRASAWVGAGAGQLWNGDAWSGVRETELGIAGRSGILAFAARIAPTVALDSLHFTDATVALTLSTARVDWSASVGNRAGARLPVANASARTWGGVSAAFWLAPRSALVVSGGTYPVDLTQGFPAGGYAAIAMRLGGARELAAAEAADARAARRVAREAGIESMEIRQAADGTHELRVRAPNARRVDWLGDPTQWTTRPLARLRDGWWSVTFVAEGAVELVLSVDGGEWIVPPGAEPVTDEFGGRVGRVLLPGLRR